MASTELRQMVEQMRSQPRPVPADFDIEAIRSGAGQMSLPVPEGVSIEAVDAGGVPGEWVRAPEADPDRRLLYLHGGGYVMMSPVTHRSLTGGISQQSGCSVLAIDYRMAPEHPFPAAVDDAVAALRWIRENGPAGAAEAAAVFIAGDSAGGGLTLSTLVATRDAGDPLPNAAVTLSAWTDLAGTGESIQTRAEADPMLGGARTEDGDGLGRMAGLYLGDADAKTPLASPLYADLGGLPPLLMQVGDAEILLDDTKRVAERAAAAGVDVTLEVEPEAFHVFQLFGAMLPEAQAAVGRIGAFIRKHG